MSDVQNNENETPAPNDNESDGFVKKEAYQKVSSDMHKYKNQMKELSAQLEAIKADTEAKEKAVLEENGKWQDLFKKAEAKLNQLQSERENERNQFVNAHKKNAVVQNLGGFKKPEYVKFVDVSKVEVREDGTVDESSVTQEVERIRKEYPELIKVTPRSALPDAAPKGTAPKTVEQMSPSELAAARRAALQKK